MASGMEIIGMNNGPQGDEQHLSPRTSSTEPLGWFFGRTHVHATHKAAIGPALRSTS